MKASPKEILNNKSNKMVDLILDEIREGGSKTIAAGFTHDKTKKNYVLTVGITVTDVEENIDTPQDLCENCSCNCKPTDTTSNPEVTPEESETTPDNSGTTPDNSGTTPNTSVGDGQR